MFRVEELENFTMTGMLEFCLEGMEKAESISRPGNGTSMDGRSPDFLADSRQGLTT